jgi:SSS family solute:Na+ symporter/sodium/proline symporter
MASIARLDVVNGAMMLAGVALAVVYLAGHTGGGGGVPSGLRPDQLTIFGALPPRDALALFLPTMFLLLGEGNMYQKFFSARDERAARLAVTGWIAGTIVVETLIVAIGMLGAIVVPGLDTAQSEAIIVRVSLDVLPAALGVLLLAGAAAIIVSTANSMLLTPATNLVRDGYQRFVRPDATDREVVLYTRLTIVALAAAGVAAGSFFPTILAMALWAYTMYGAGITPALLAAFLWPRATRRAGVWSIAAGMLVTLSWEVVAVLWGSAAAPRYLLGVQTIYAALAASISTLVAVSLADPAPAGTDGPSAISIGPTIGPA